MLMQLPSTTTRIDCLMQTKERVVTRVDNSEISSGVCQGVTEGAEYRIMVNRALTIQVRKHLFVVKGGKQTAGSAGRRRESSSEEGLRTHAHWLEIDISSCYLDSLERQELEKVKKSVDRGVETMAELVAEEERSYIPRRRSQIC